jgi:hypothetical protein
MIVTQPMLYALTAALLFGIGVYGLLSRPHLLRRLVALNLMGASVFLLLVAFARRDPEAASIRCRTRWCSPASSSRSAPRRSAWRWRAGCTAAPGVTLEEDDVR